MDAKLLGTWHAGRGLGIGAGDERDCAYHFVVHPDGEIEAARPLSVPSAGTKSLEQNARSIDVVLVGDFEPAHNRGHYYPQRPTTAQLRSLQEVALWAAREYDFGAEDVLGHKEATPGTACPGKRVDMDSVRDRLSSAIAAGARAKPPTNRQEEE